MPGALSSQTSEPITQAAGGQTTVAQGAKGAGANGGDPIYVSGQYDSYGQPSQPGPQGGGVNAQTHNPGAYDIPNIGQNIYSSGDAFNDYNAANIYGLVGQGMAQSQSRQAPIAYNTQLGQATQYGGAQAAPQMMLGGAQMGPMQMTSGAQLGTTQDNQYAAAQNQQLNALYAQAQGQGPSVATTQAQQLAQQNIAQQAAMLGSQRGSGSAALGQRAAADQAATANQAAAQQGALGRSQEAMAAQQQVGALLSGARGQSQATSQAQAQLAQQADLANQSQYNQAATGQAQLNQQAGLANQSTAANASLQNAQLSQQAGLANAGALNQFGLQQGQMNQQTSLANQQTQFNEQQLDAQQYQAMLQAYMGQNQTDISNSAAYQQMLANQELQKYGIDQGVAVNTANNNMGLAGAGIGATGSLVGAGIQAASDERLKKNVKGGESAIRAFLDALGVN